MTFCSMMIGLWCITIQYINCMHEYKIKSTFLGLLSRNISFRLLTVRYFKALRVSTLSKKPFNGDTFKTPEHPFIVESRVKIIEALIWYIILTKELLFLQSSRSLLEQYIGLCPIVIIHGLSLRFAWAFYQTMKQEEINKSFDFKLLNIRHLNTYCTKSLCLNNKLFYNDMIILKASFIFLKTTSGAQYFLNG